MLVTFFDFEPTARQVWQGDLQSLHCLKESSGSQAGCFAPLRTWFKWLARENHMLYNPASELELPRQGKHLPRVVLSVQEVERILAEADVNNPQGLRATVPYWKCSTARHYGAPRRHR